jgi:SAM-dependent methyltransferase
LGRYGYEYWDKRASQPIPDVETVGIVGTQFLDHLPAPAERMLQRSGLVLDAGCGYGRFAVPLATRGFTVVGVDASIHMLQRFQLHIAEHKLENAHLIRSSITHLPFRAGIFATAYCAGTVFYIDRKMWPKVFYELRRVAMHSSVQERNVLSPYNLRRKLVYLVLVKILRVRGADEMPDEHLTLPNRPSLSPTFYKTFTGLNDDRHREER